MSTPRLLARQSVTHLHVLGHGHVALARPTLNGQQSFHGTLAVCAYGEVDFQVQPEAEPETTGELEKS